MADIARAVGMDVKDLADEFPSQPRPIMPQLKGNSRRKQTNTNNRITNKPKKRSKVRKDKSPKKKTPFDSQERSPAPHIRHVRSVGNALASNKEAQYPIPLKKSSSAKGKSESAEEKRPRMQGKSGDIFDWFKR